MKYLFILIILLILINVIAYYISKYMSMHSIFGCLYLSAGLFCAAFKYK